MLGRWRPQDRVYRRASTWQEMLNLQVPLTRSYFQMFIYRPVANEPGLLLTLADDFEIANAWHTSSTDGRWCYRRPRDSS
jgi:hypothetical protein